jgi:hypothetical protein
MRRRSQNEIDADRHPVKYGRDHSGRITLGEIVRELGDLFAAGAPEEEICQFLDREFIFGTWGDVMREVRDRNFPRDIRGFIVAAYKEGRERGARR